MILCDFFAEGDPFGQPRLRPRLSRSGALGVHMPRTAEGWRLAVLLAARRAWDKAPLGGPLEVDLRFLMRRPKSHYTRSGELRSSAPAYPVSKPDRDNVEKSTQDALNGVLYVDDAQIVGGWVGKRYADDSEPGVIVTVRTAE